MSVDRRTAILGTIGAAVAGSLSPDLPPAPQADSPVLAIDEWDVTGKPRFMQMVVRCHEIGFACGVREVPISHFYGQDSAKDETPNS